MFSILGLITFTGYKKLTMPEERVQTTFIDPFVDFSFKRLFSSEQSKPILIGLLNHLFRGRKYITEIEFGKNEFPGEHAEEGGVLFDVYCTDADGSRFIIEIQRGYQKNFKERALFYASRAISEQAPKGKRNCWAYNLTEEGKTYV
jgi:predicted transposase/invertase (TIGR01784 family)